MPLFWTAVVGLELFLLLNDITLFQAPKSELPVMTGERIAELVESSGGVRWQNPKDVVWNETRPGQILFEGQSLMTLSDSSARLLFDGDGGGPRATGELANSTELSVGPRTLLQLQIKRAANGAQGPLLLSLSRGTVRARTGRAMEIASGDIAGSPDSARYSVQLDPGAAFDAVRIPSEQSQSGKPAVQLTLREGTARAGNVVLEKNQTIEFAAEGEPASAPVVVSGIAGSPPPFSVPSPEPSPVASVPPARTLSLPPPKVRTPTLRRRLRTSPPAREGASLFHWLFPSAVAAEPELKKPTSNLATDEEWDLELEWEPVAGASAYRIQVSRTRNFSNPLAEETTPLAKWTWVYRRGMENSKGRVFYRIRSISASGKPGRYSDPKIFTIPEEVRLVVRKERAEPEFDLPDVPPIIQTSRPTWSFRAGAEYSSLTQKTDFPQLRRVDTGGYVHETFSVGRRASGGYAEGSFRSNHFKSAGSTLAKSRAFRGALAWQRPTTLLADRLSLGVVGSLEHRFEKRDLNSVRIAHAISFGPSLRYNPDRAAMSPNWAVTLHLPLTGIFLKGILGGAYGPSLLIEGTHLLSTYESGSLYLSATTEGRLQFFSEPEGTKVTEWSIGFGPKFFLK